MGMIQLSRQFGRYCTLCITLLVCFATLTLITAAPQDPKIRLQEKYRTGDEYQVETTSTVNGVLQKTSDSKQQTADLSIKKTGTAKSLYQERVLAVDQGLLATKTIRRYQRLSAQQTIGDQTESAQLREAVRNIVLIRDSTRDVTFSPDGPMTLAELEQVRTDVFLPRLAGLLPTQQVGIGDNWTASSQAVQELTDLQQIQSGQLQCTLREIKKSANSDLAVVTISGKVTGTGPLGPNEQTLQGKYHFELVAQRLTSLQFEVTSIILDKNKKKVGDLTASYRLVREFKTPSPQPSPAEGRGRDDTGLDPTEENTLLLARETKLGVELTHSRRWAPRPPGDKQWIIDGPSGSGLTIQFEQANKIPDAQQLQKEIETTLSKAAQGLKAEPDPAGWTETNRSAQRLSWRGSQNGKEYVFDYFLWKQGEKGAIVAARYFAPEAREAQRDAERIVRSLRLDKN
jgi:hypothetical protein